MQHKKPIIAFPWQRQGVYFGIDSSVSAGNLFAGHWTKSTEDLNNDGAPERTTTRSRDEHGRVVKVEIVDVQDATRNKTINLTYDYQGRVVTYDFQEQARPHTTTYIYDSHDHLIQETSVTTDLTGGRHTGIAHHTIGGHGNIAQTLVTADGKKREERQYTPFGEIRSMKTFDDNEIMFSDEESTFDNHQRQIRRQNRQLAVDAATGTSRVISDEVEESTYFGNTTKLATSHRVITREFEKSPGVRLMLKAFEETRTSAPAAGGVGHFEGRTFNPGPDDQPLAIELRIEETTFDAQGRQIAFSGTNTNLNTGESKAVRSVTTYRTITVTTTDLGADGTDDEESVTIADEAGRVSESRDGKPNFGPFTDLQRLSYNDGGELVKRVTFENNSDVPTSVVIFS